MRNTSLLNNFILFKQPRLTGELKIDMSNSLLLIVIIAFIAISVASLFKNIPGSYWQNWEILKLRTLKVNRFVIEKIGTSSKIDHAIKGSRKLVPIGYVLVISLCLYLFFKHVFFFLPSSVKHSFFHQSLISASIASIYFITIVVVFLNPGVIKKHNVSRVNSHFENNNLIFFSNKFCSTCNIIKPARSKHCSVCDHCVMFFDHHCLWLDKCIGYYNYKWFLAYLFSNIEFLSYGAYLCYLAIVNQWPNGRRWSWKIILDSTLDKTSRTLFLLAVIYTVITIVFTSFHIRYLYLGVTTNECEKWSDIEYLVDRGLLYQVLDDQAEEKFVEQCISRNMEDNTYETVYISLKDERILFEQHTKLPLKRIVSVANELDNIYDKGFINNAKERIFTIDLG